ncbi:solute carrier family 30 member 7 [Dermatophagoides pteronyssinus]|uniref:solute carrier family 30 member 7 n=1 Tax=Dermatophagoides pteronyssinus TaxID=6956 RepID=UPI003F6629FF
MLPIYSSNDNNNKFTKSNLTFYRIREKIQGWLRLIFSDRNSRNLLLFLLLNFSFAFVELFYGIWTNSLGLISDSFHMFFDCTALVAGLIASIVTKWRANQAFTYGYVRAEILAGFVNGLFLIFVAFFIFAEAIERAIEPPEVKHERLFVISVLGLLVNIIGIFVFQHGGSHHGHSHGGGSDHGHSHSSYDHHHHEHEYHNHQQQQHPETINMLNNSSSDPYTFVTVNGYGNNNNDPYQPYPSSANHNHSHGGGPVSNDHHHSHSHSHSHGGGAPTNQIMKGVFLHIVADTLGSVGVIISALLMSQFGWMIADPLCSMFISFLIVISVYPLLSESGAILMQRQPRELDSILPNCYRRVSQLDGVKNIHEAHFWTLCSGQYVGALKIEIRSDNVNPAAIVNQTNAIFQQVGIKNLHVQIDYV